MARLVGELRVHGLVVVDLVPEAARARLAVLDLLEAARDGGGGEVHVAGVVAARRAAAGSDSWRDRDHILGRSMGLKHCF